MEQSMVMLFLDHLGCSATKPGKRRLPTSTLASLHYLWPVHASYKLFHFAQRPALVPSPNLIPSFRDFPRVCLFANLRPASLTLLSEFSSVYALPRCSTLLFTFPSTFSSPIPLSLLHYLHPQCHHPSLLRLPSIFSAHSFDYLFIRFLHPLPGNP